MPYTFELTANREEGDSVIWNNLVQFNLQFAEPDQHTLLGIFARNEMSPSGAGCMSIFYGSMKAIAVQV
jgi:hypothetical protein